jgi:PIN domain nuclease of toxin-antitoxin system
VKVLLDTHTFLWAIAEPARLSGEVRRLLADEANELVLSTVSLWEIVIKAGAGKLRIPAGAEYFETHMDHLGVGRVLPITPVHVYAVAGLPEAHKDPFDRLLVAQCRVEGMPLVSADEVFRRYPIETIW